MTMANVVDLQAWKGRLSVSKQGVKKTVTNLLMYLENLPEFGAKLRWNSLAHAVEWNGRELEEHQLIDIRVILEAHQFEPQKGDLLPAVISHARSNSYHPITDYLDTLKWDGTKRLNHWLRVCMGAPDSPFVRAVGRKTLISAVARAFEPGCKVDTILIFEGPQGIRKSTAIATLFSPALTMETVNLFDQHNKMVMNMMGKWCVELAEFTAALRKDEDSVKGLVSMRTDRVALPYAKTSTDHPRSVVFIGTYNPDGMGYFNDTTGNRRYWPVPVTKANIEKIAEVRDQLWAEAVELYRSGEQWWLTDEEEGLAKAEVEKRESVDVWQEILFEKLIRTGVASTSVGAALKEIGVPPERMDKKARNRAAKVLRNLGYIPDDKPTKDEERRSIRVFRRPSE